MPSDFPALLKEGRKEAEKVKGAQLPKKQRQRDEWAAAQWEGSSLKGDTYDVHYRSVSLKTFPIAPQTNPYKCHKSCQMYI